MDAAVEVGSIAARAIDPLGQDIGAGLELLENFGDGLPAMFENLNKGADADRQQECDDQSRHSAPQGRLRRQQTAIGRLGDRLCQSLD